MQGKRKVNLHSRYPTIAIDMERRLKGVFGSTGSYERIEVDLQHTIPLGGLRNIYYRLGGEHLPIKKRCTLSISST